MSTPTQTPLPKKRHRSSSSTRLSTLLSDNHHHILHPSPSGFNDPSSSDVLLRLFPEPSDFNNIKPDPTTTNNNNNNNINTNNNEIQIYLHSSKLHKAKYFSTLLSPRWHQTQTQNDQTTLPLPSHTKLNLSVSPTTGTMQAHVAVLQLLYTADITDITFTPSDAISLLPVASKLLFEDLVNHILTFLEAVPWTEDQEAQILSLSPYLSEAEARHLCSRMWSGGGGGNNNTLHQLERMMENLLATAKQQNYTNLAPVKAFVARLMRENFDKETARRVLERAFVGSLKVVKESLEEYSSPSFRGDHNETEAIQRLNLHTALTNGKHLLWLVERMIELRVADVAVREWSEQDCLVADLQRAFRDDAWRNIVPGLPTVVLKCTLKLASAVAAGSILVAREVRMKLVKDWLPVLIVCKDNSSPVLPSHKPVLHSPKTLYFDLEETFLRIISTLPMDDAQELLQQCLSFSTRDSEDCQHLVAAFNTWFRRALRPPQGT